MPPELVSRSQPRCGCVDEAGILVATLLLSVAAPGAVHAKPTWSAPVRIAPAEGSTVPPWVGSESPQHAIEYEIYVNGVLSPHPVEGPPGWSAAGSATALQHSFRNVIVR
jgi:hypothetical protein